MYYPDQAKKHKWLQEELGLLSAEDQLQFKNKTFDFSAKISSVYGQRRSSEGGPG